ncbi:unnamed protein product, partial [Vitis vinifera]
MIGNYLINILFFFFEFNLLENDLRIIPIPHNAIAPRRSSNSIRCVANPPPPPSPSSALFHRHSCPNKLPPAAALPSDSSRSPRPTLASTRPSSPALGIRSSLLRTPPNTTAILISICIARERQSAVILRQIVSRPQRVIPSEANAQSRHRWSWPTGEFRNPPILKQKFLLLFSENVL